MRRQLASKAAASRRRVRASVLLQAPDRSPERGGDTTGVRERQKSSGSPDTRSNKVGLASGGRDRRRGLGSRRAHSLAGMKTVLLANNRLGWEIGRYLRGRGELAGLVLHPPAQQKYGGLLRRLDVPTWEWPDGLEGVRDLSPECLLSVLFGQLVPEDWLEVPVWKALNLHPGLLPWNGGSNPNVWPLVDGSPAGTTLHVMERTLDTGPIVAQTPVPSYPDDTGLTLYRRLETASMELFRHVWPRIRDMKPIAQSTAAVGSYHRSVDLASLDVQPEEFPVIDKLRARTFEPFGAEFERDGGRFRIRVAIDRLD